MQKLNNGFNFDLRSALLQRTRHRLFNNLQQNLSISSICNRSVEIKLVATCHVQTWYNLLRQLVAGMRATSFDNQLATSLLKTCYGRVVNKLSQVMQTHSDIGLLITTSLLQLARFWLPRCCTYSLFCGSSKAFPLYKSHESNPW